MYKLKQIPEDFIVKEIKRLDLSSGRFAYVKVRKKLRNTLDVVREISKQLGIKDKKVGFAGSKDKHAITEQYFSIEGIKEDKIKLLDIENVWIEFIGYGKNPISLGNLEGNEFEIVVRNLDSVNVKEISFVANYFDEQRFSVNNAGIGKHLIKKEFSDACKLIDDFRMKRYLEEHTKDYIGALKKIPSRLLRMYVNAYQSYLWNETLAKYLDTFKSVEVDYSLGKFVFVSEKLDLKVPLIGFDTEFNDDKIKEIVNSLMEKEGISFDDFVIKQIPELSREGELRNAFIDLKEFKFGYVEEDDLNIGKKKVKVSFILGKGSYATMVVRKLFK
jgi:tRNA pseudouridine13 synthase